MTADGHTSLRPAHEQLTRIEQAVQHMMGEAQSMALWPPTRALQLRSLNGRLARLAEILEHATMVDPKDTSG